jgi:hypothetical protein
MDRTDPDELPGSQARDNDRVVQCPACASELRRVIVILDTRKGMTVRMFKCLCGELVWDD